MAYYAIGERQLLPGEMSNFIEATRQIAAHFTRSGRRQDEFNLYVAESDPNLALLVGRWPDREQFASAQAGVPAELVEAVTRPVVAGGGQWRWYATVREIMEMSQQPTVLVASRFRIDAAEPFLAWARRFQNEATRLPGVHATRLLAALDAPDEFAHLGEYADAAVVDAISHLATDMAPPTPLLDWRRFVGRLGYHWDRPTPGPAP